MNTVTLNSPGTPDRDDNAVAMLVASQLYERDKSSSEQAAGVAGLTKRTLTEPLGKDNVSIFTNPASDLWRDVAGA